MPLHTLHLVTRRAELRDAVLELPLEVGHAGRVAGLVYGVVNPYLHVARHGGPSEADGCPRARLFRLCLG